MSLASRLVLTEIESPIDDSDWTLVEVGGRPGVCAHFDGDRVSPGQIERLIARHDPLLAPIADHGEDDEGSYIIWDGSLEDTLATLSGPLSMGEIALLADVLLAGLERLHNAGFIHPGLDVGVVRLQVDGDGRAVPELVGLGMPVPPGRSARDDLRDVGVILYRLYTGREPFEAGQPSDGSVPPPTFADARPGVSAPVAFELAVMRALGPSGERFVNAAEMRAHLAAAPIRRTGITARSLQSTDPSMRRALTSGVSGLESLLAPELQPAIDSKHRQAPGPLRRRLALAPAVILAAASLIIGFGIGRLTHAERASAAVIDGSALRPLADVASSPIITAQALTPSAAPGTTAPPSDAAPAVVQPGPATVQVSQTKLTVISDPPGATVLLRKQKRLEKAPFTMDVTADMLPLELVFDKKSHFPRREFVEKLDGPEMTVTVKMKPRD